MAMPVRTLTSLGLLLALLLVHLGGCAPRLAPAVPPGLALEPGRYIAAVYRNPDFTPIGVTYAVKPFSVEMARGVDPGTFQGLLQTELVQAMEANGLKLAPQGDATLTGVVQQVELRGKPLRFITGKICADLLVSGTISHQDQTLLAFQDRIHFTSPVNPGPPAPKEDELLLRQVAQTFAVHLLNELLLYWPPAAGK
jgi:hypothetical protein